MSNFLHPRQLISSTGSSVISVITTNRERSEVPGSLGPVLRKGGQGPKPSPALGEQSPSCSPEHSAPNILESSCTSWSPSQPTQAGPCPQLLSQRCDSTSGTGCAGCAPARVVSSLLKGIWKYYIHIIMEYPKLDFLLLCRDP